MSTRVAEYRSESNPNKNYEVIMGGDGVVYCSCPGWKNRKTCKHLLDYSLGGNGAKQLYIKDLHVDVKNKPDATGDDLDDIVRRASLIMREQ